MKFKFEGLFGIYIMPFVVLFEFVLHILFSVDLLNFVCKLLVLGKNREDVEEFLNSGVYQVERLKEEGWVTNILYDDEVQIPPCLDAIIVANYK
jgi:hypothetical protein